MKIEIYVNGKPVEIELTDSQIQQVKQDKPVFNWKDVTSVKYLYDNVEGFQLPYSFDETKLQKRINAHYILSIVFELINEGWTPDWKNTKQPKWRTYFYWDIETSGFSSCIFGFYHTPSVGSDLHTETREKMEHILKHFENEYLEMLF